MHRKLPTYRRHSSGQAMVKIAGRSHYLGVFGTDRSRERYRQLLAEWVAAGCPNPWHLRAPGSMVVSALTDAYLEHARGYYRRRDGSTTRTDRSVACAMRYVVNLFGSLPAKDFSIASLRACRAAMIANGVSRVVTNAYVRWIRRAFRFGVTEGLVPAPVWHELLALEPLQRGRSPAPDYPRVQAVPIEYARAVQRVSRPIIAAMIEVQILTGMRPGEVCRLRVDEIDRSRTPWIYRPTQHKTAHKGKVREIALGPRARAVIAQWIRLDTPRIFPVKIDRYREAIVRAQVRAKVPHWTPNQLRHFAGTKFEAEFGIEAARALLGHSSVATTDIYVHRDRSVAESAMERIG